MRWSGNEESSTILAISNARQWIANPMQDIALEVNTGSLVIFNAEPRLHTHSLQWDVNIVGIGKEPVRTPYDYDENHDKYISSVWYNVYSSEWKKFLLPSPLLGSGICRKKMRLR